MTLSRLRLILAVLLVVSGIAFAAGSAAERSSNHEAAQQPSTGSSPTQSEGGSTEGSGGEGSATEPATHTESTANSETLLGVNPESTALVAVAVILSLLLAAVVWFRGRRPVLIAALVFGLVFAAFDIREALHQSGESHTGLMVVAIVLALLHGAIVTFAALALRASEASPVPA